MTKTLALLFAAATFSQSHAANVPTAYTIGGGGFKTMTESMGIMRAFNDAGLLDNIATHFGCCSGGCWFQTQFSYSPTFYAETLGHTNKTVYDCVVDWGAAYGESVQRATAASMFNDISYEVQTQTDACALTTGVNGESLANVFETAVNALMTAFAFPASNWFYYIESLIGTTLLDPSKTTFSSPRGGFPDGTLVYTSTLGPDIWDNTAESKPQLIGLPDNVTLMPISYVAPPSSNGDWVYPSTIKQALVVSNHGETVQFDSGPPESLTEVNAACSAVGGGFGSPTLFNNFMTYILDGINNNTSAERTALEESITNCAPFGFQNWSSPTEGNVKSTTSSSWSPKFRYIDGGYSECTSVPSSISSMQRDCLVNGNEYDCSKGIRLFNIFAGNVTEHNTTQRLFSGCSCGKNNYPYIGNAIDPVIFAEEFPHFEKGSEGNGWTIASNITYDFSPNGEPSVTYAWRGTVTTIDNPGFNVVAGTKVDIVFLFIELPDSVSLLSPSRGSSAYFASSYAVIAQEMYDSMLPYFEELAKDWSTTPRRLLRGSKSKANKRRNWCA